MGNIENQCNTMQIIQIIIALKKCLNVNNQDVAWRYLSVTFFTLFNCYETLMLIMEVKRLIKHKKLFWMQCYHIFSNTRWHIFFKKLPLSCTTRNILESGSSTREKTAQEDQLHVHWICSQCSSKRYFTDTLNAEYIFKLHDQTTHWIASCKINCHPGGIDSCYRCDGIWASQDYFLHILLEKSWWSRCWNTMDVSCSTIH